MAGAKAPAIFYVKIFWFPACRVVCNTGQTIKFSTGIAPIGAVAL
jgi:hypothetical protein